MVSRIVKVFFGVTFAISIGSEYKNIVKQTGGDIFTLSFVCLICAFSLLVSYTGIKNVPIKSYLTRRVITISSIIILAAVAGGAIYSNSNDYKISYINRIYLNGNLDKALSKIEIYLEDNPNDDLAWTIKGNILKDKHIVNKAEEAYQIALGINDRNFKAINALGVLYRLKRNYEQAMTWYRKALEIKPQYAPAYTGMAVIELKRNNYVEALRFAKKAYELDSNEPVIASNLAVAFHYNGNRIERDRFTEIAKQLGSQDIEALQRIYSGKINVKGE